MRYFTDEQIQQMRKNIREEFGNDRDGIIYLAYVSKLEVLNKRYDEFGDCKDELMQTIVDLQRFAGQYVRHKGKVDVNDLDADAFEYENFDYAQAPD